MKFYYIDDSFFKESIFLYQMRERLLMLCERDYVPVLFISGTDVVGVQFDGFIEICSENNIRVICSPAQIHMFNLNGVLTANELLLEGFESIHAYSGSVVCIDTDSKICERLYLDFFPDHSMQQSDEDITHEIEDILGDVIMKHKKNQKYN